MTLIVVGITAFIAVVGSITAVVVVAVRTRKQERDESPEAGRKRAQP